MKWVLWMVVLFSGCSLAPQYSRPDIAIPVAYKEIKPWQTAKPRLAELNHTAWWKMYHDPLLNRLEEKVDFANQNLKEAIARYEEARAIAAVAWGAYFPTILANFNLSQQQASQNVANADTQTSYGDNSLGLNFLYEVDVWGRVRNTVAAAKSLERASAADVAVIKLGLQAECASNYFALRGADTAQKILDKTVRVYQKAYDLVRYRYAGDIASIMDVDQAKAQLDAAKVLADDNRIKRAEFEHAIAVLVGESPSAFTISPAVSKFEIVTIDPVIPSTLLERRPDIAKAELEVKAANAGIGIARAAYFPAINLSGGVGLESKTFSNIFNGSSFIWALGPTAVSPFFNNINTSLATFTVIDGGRIRALSDKARAKYVATVAHYRQTVLTSFQEVEDSLIAIRQLDHERKNQHHAVQFANRAVRQAMYRYKEGLTTYLEVVMPQNLALQAELRFVDIYTRRQLASVRLIKALGGGWESSDYIKQF